MTVKLVLTSCASVGECMYNTTVVSERVLSTATHLGQSFRLWMLAFRHQSSVVTRWSAMTLLVVLLVIPLTRCAPTFIDTGHAQFYKIVLDVFSGRPNPTWILDREHPLYPQIATDLNKIQHTESRDSLGYRGFSVEMRNPFGQRLTKTVRAGTFSLLELELLRSCPFTIRDPVRDHIINVITELTNTSGSTRFYQQLDDPQSYNKMPYCKHPKFNPEKWNRPLDRITNNCYNYATQRKTNTFAQPGRATGQLFGAFTAEEVLSATVRDGLVHLPFLAPALFRKMCIIALVVWPNEDYHFYRLDDNYKWSHKMGWDPVTNYDNNGKIIWDPQRADRGRYTVFVAYLGVHPGISVL